MQPREKNLQIYKSTFHSIYSLFCWCVQLSWSFQNRQWEYKSLAGLKGVRVLCPCTLARQQNCIWIPYRFRKSLQTSFHSFVSLKRVWWETPAEVPRHRSSLWSCVIWVLNKTNSDKWGFPSGSIGSYIQVWGGWQKANWRGSKPRGQSEERCEGMPTESPPDYRKQRVRCDFFRAYFCLYVCKCDSVHSYRHWWWVCVCVSWSMLSSANVMLPSLVGRQKPALAENQLQVRMLAVILSLSEPKRWECSQLARIPKWA